MALSRKTILYVIIGLGLAFLPVLIKSIYTLHIINMVLVSIIVTSGVNIIMGYLGQFMLAQAALYGIGAYTSAILATRLGLSFWICLPAAIAVTSVAGLLISLPCLKVKGHYLAIVSLGLAVVIHEAMVNLMWLTNGPSGILRIPAPSFFGISLNTDHRYYPLLLIFAFVSVLFVKLILSSRVGRAFIAIRESYTAAEAMGIDHRFYKILGFVLSAAYAGLAGSLYAHLVKFISPDSFGMEELLLEIAMLLVGGIGTLAGPILGSTILSFMYEYLRALKGYQMVVYGLMILLFVIFIPKGLVTITDRILLLRKRVGRGTSASQS
jgi:branched-chain amino acid transport system permease protein